MYGGVCPHWCMCTHTNYKEVNSNRVASSGERQLVQEQHTSHQGTKTLGHEKTVYNLCTHLFNRKNVIISGVSAALFVFLTQVSVSFNHQHV